MQNKKKQLGNAWTKPQLASVLTTYTCEKIYNEQRFRKHFCWVSANSAVEKLRPLIWQWLRDAGEMSHYWAVYTDCYISYKYCAEIPIKTFIQTTTPRLFNSPLSGTTRVSRLDFTEARDSEWQWHQLGHMQVCTSLQTDNHTTQFLQAGCPSCRPTNSVKALKHYSHTKTVKYQEKRSSVSPPTDRCRLMQL